MKRYKHKLPHGRNTTFNMGPIVPVGRLLATRNETYMHSTSMFYRVNTLVHPVMHPVNTYLRHIFTPFDLVWTNWRDYISGGEDNDDTSEHPYIDFSGSPVTKGTLAHHLGYPIGFAGNANALYFRAYTLYWNEHVRDDQLQAKAPIALTDGEDTVTNTELLNDNWNKDPFTSARPDDQLGTDVTISLGGTAPVGAMVSSTFEQADTRADGASGGVASWVQYGSDQQYADGTQLVAELSSATGISLSALAFAIQEGRLKELINKTGNDYDDFLRRYGIRVNSQIIDRPHILATSKQTIQFSEVLATAEGANTNVGDMAGHGIAAQKSNRYKHHCKEDGVILSLACVKPISMYMDSVDRTLEPMNRLEYFQREYENLGMQEIKNRHVQHDHSSPDGTFGYEDRYNHLKRIPNTVHGEFADLDKDWHLARSFTGDVALNSSFITCNPTTRIFADTTQDQLKVMVKHNVQKISPIRPRSPMILSNL